MRRPWFRRLLAAAVLAAPLAFVPGAARADVLSDIGKSVVKIEADALDLEQGIRPPTETAKTDDVARRRLVEAQVAHGVGNFADASILLYDIVEHYPSSSAYKDAVFLLADALFQKGDLLTARKYFRVVVNDFGENDANYGKSLERLLELSLSLKDDEGVPDLLARLDRIPASRQLPSAPYIRGKYAYFTGDLDAAIRAFNGVDQGNEYYFQSQYFLGACYIAKDELAQAAKVYSDLLKVPVKPGNDKQDRIVQLSHLALGRIHYTRDQLTEAVDQYLQVDRRSDLFDEALYEIAFVYVKAKQYDKALRALELLEMATGGSCSTPNRRVNTVGEMPEVCILKGNLGIRRAQSFADTGKGNPVADYNTALGVFENTRNAYQQPKAELDRVIAENADPKKYFASVVNDDAFDSEIQLPPMARQWLKKEEGVARVVGVTRDLKQIRKDLEEAEALIARLERIVTSPQRFSIFPSLAGKRAKAMDARDRLLDYRVQLAAQSRAIMLKYSSGAERAEIEALGAKRAQLAAELAGLRGKGDYEARVARARELVDGLDKQAKEVEVIITSLEAELAALEKYYADTGGKGMSKEAFDRDVASIRGQIDTLKAELVEVRKDLVLAKDSAGVGDEIADEERRLARDLYEATKAEHDKLQAMKGRMSGGDLQKVSEIEGLLGKIAAVEAVLQRVTDKIDRIVDTELAEVRVVLAQEKQSLMEAKGLLAQYEDENLTLGSEVVAGSLGAVSKKFYEIGVRAEVGIIDVSWARREDAEDYYNKIEIDSAREKKVLETEFSEVAFDEEPQKKEAPPPPPAPTPAPGGGGNAP